MPVYEKCMQCVGTKKKKCMHKKNICSNAYKMQAKYVYIVQTLQ